MGSGGESYACQYCGQRFDFGERVAHERDCVPALKQEVRALKIEVKEMKQRNGLLHQEINGLRAADLTKGIVDVELENQQLRKERDAFAMDNATMRELLSEAIDKVPEGYSILRDRMDTACLMTQPSDALVERARLEHEVVEATKALHPEPYSVVSDRHLYERLDRALAALKAFDEAEKIE